MRESNDGHVCSVCLETIYHEQCGCCPECGHKKHAKPCEHNSDHHLADFGAVAGPCGCSEPSVDGMGRDLMQTLLEMYSLNYPSPLLSKRKRLEVSFDEIELEEYMKVVDAAEQRLDAEKEKFE